MNRFVYICVMCVWICLAGFSPPASAESTAYKGKIFDPGHLNPRDSVLKVSVGDKAPDFTLPSISGHPVRLSDFKGKSNVMLTFIPAAWTPVCSDQWPGYNIARELFKQNGFTVIGISVDPIASLYAWTREMGTLWFDVVSDFWPHGAVSSTYGVLRSDGVSERAIFLIDKEGILRFIHVSDINVRPDLGMIVKEMKKLNLK